MIRVMIADDQVLFNELLGHMLSGNEEIRIIASVYNGVEVIESARELKPDVILMDLSMPLLNGIDALKAIREEGIPSKVLILTSSDESEDITEAIKIGANGYVLKSVTKERLILAIKSIHAGMEVFDKNVHAFERPNQNQVVRLDRGIQLKVQGVAVELTDRDLSVIEMIVDGKSAAEIAKELFVAEGRARNIITELIAKLMLKDKTQLVVFAIKNRLIEFKR